MNTEDHSSITKSINQIVYEINSVSALANSNSRNYRLSNALLIDLISTADSINNFSYVVNNSYTSNLPTDCAWGVRTVEIINEKSAIIRILGCDVSGTKAKLWINCYNFNNWTGWRSF